MKVRDIFKNTIVALDVEASSKEELIRKLVDYFPFDKYKKDFIYDTILKRESFGSTGIGDGIAIPHARILLIKELSIIIARLKKPIDFNSIDNKPVKFVFLIVAPPNDPKNRYLITLGKIAELAVELNKNKKLFETNDQNEFLEELIKILEKKK
uniref:PTS sugar transporter subunit IIA n=1 Tax=candidate division WOR-3 bacterium TaxID=2052148 RepID=A0A7C4Y6I0_UNCW3